MSHTHYRSSAYYKKIQHNIQNVGVAFSLFSGKPDTSKNFGHTVNRPTVHFGTAYAKLCVKEI